MGRRESDILLLWVNPERILVLRAEGVGSAGWVLHLPVVTEDNVEEENGDTDLNEEGENVTPGAPIPGIITPSCSIRSIQRGACDGTPDSPSVENSISGCFFGTNTEKGFLLGEVNDDLSEAASEDAERSQEGGEGVDPHEAELPNRSREETKNLDNSANDVQDTHSQGSRLEARHSTDAGVRKQSERAQSPQERPKSGGESDEEDDGAEV